MSKFEIPYNWDLHEIEILEKKIPGFLKNVESFYLPAFIEHSHATRIELQRKIPKTLDEYETHINYLKSHGVKICILLQELDNDISLEILKYYIDDLGIRLFTVVQDRVAKRIKDYNKDCIINASILKCLKYKDILSKDLSMYDRIVLLQKFNVCLDVVKELPKTHEYIIIPNSFCHYKCKPEWCLDHWRGNLNPKCVDMPFDDVTVIYPEDLYLFEPYISVFKLQGRDRENTEFLLELIMPYLTGKSDGFIKKGSFISVEERMYNVFKYNGSFE